MNLVDNYVIEILGEPIETEYGYKLYVMVDCYGSKFKHTLLFPTKEEADNITVGYKFLA